MDATQIFIIQTKEDKILGVFNTFANAVESLNYSYHKLGKCKIEQVAHGHWEATGPDGKVHYIAVERLHHNVVHI